MSEGKEEQKQLQEHEQKLAILKERECCSSSTFVQSRRDGRPLVLRSVQKLAFEKGIGYDLFIPEEVSRMAIAVKKTISLPPDLAKEVDRLPTAAARTGPASFHLVGAGGGGVSGS